MNYGKKGIKQKQLELNAIGFKWAHKLSLLLIKFILVCILSSVVLLACVGFGAFAGILSSAPDLESINIIPTGYASYVYDSEGNEIAKLVATDANRDYQKMENIPQYLADAFVAIEDERFYEHNGIDIKGIIRAGFTGVTSGDFSQGASTITQQLLKNNVFDNWVGQDDFIVKLKRKIQEQYLAIEIEKIYSKEEILEYYMNTINLGQSTLGVQAASKRYFNKSTYELTLSECAVIAAITQNPSKYNPISHPDKNANRRGEVLNKMLEQGYITKAEYDEAVADDVYSRIKEVNEVVINNSVNTYFVDAVTDSVLQDLKDRLGYNDTQAYMALYSSGLRIFSTQDSSVQAIADSVFQNEENYPKDIDWLLKYDLTIERADGSLENFSSEMYKKYWEETNKNFNMIYSSQEDAYAATEAYSSSLLGEGDSIYAESITLTPQPQISLVVCDQYTGYVVAMVGGRGTKEGSRTLNRATDSKRQPGSTFKIVSTYAPALDSAGLTLASVQIDAPYRYSTGTPVKNWWGARYEGIQSLRWGIEQSANIIAVKTLTQITPQLGYDYLLKFGFTTLVERRVDANGQVFSDIQQPLALGGITDGVTNLELNAAYATIANGGTYCAPKLYTKILNADGSVLIDNSEPEQTQVLKETTAYLLTSAMVDVVTKGTGTKCNFGGSTGMAIAGKTGTTSSYNDVWFCGFTPYYTASVWAGYDNNEKMTNPESKNLAKTLWRAVMEEIHKDLPAKGFTMPSGITTCQVCAQSGKLPIEGLCSKVTTEYFAEGTVPTESCDVHYAGWLCAYSTNGVYSVASPECPFKIWGTCTLMPQEDEKVLSGSTTVDAAGNVVYSYNVTGTCPHNAAFFADPNSAAIAAQQQAELGGYYNMGTEVPTQQEQPGQQSAPEQPQGPEQPGPAQPGN